jgi:DNA-binding YbaB/EbfC family protein
MGIFDQVKQMKDAFSQIGNMQEKQAELQKRLAQLHVIGSAGAGMVEVTASGEGNITDIKINPIMFNADDSKMLENLILSATNEALRKSKETMAHEVKNILGFNPKDLENIMNQMNQGGNPPV